MKKDKIYKTYYVEKNNVDKLAKHEERTGLKKSTIVNKALDQYFKKGDKNGS